jgi:hypothetical protein
MWLTHEMHTRLTVKQIAAFIGYHFSSGKAGQLESCWFGRFLYRLPGSFIGSRKTTRTIPPATYMRSCRVMHPPACVVKAQADELQGKSADDIISEQPLASEEQPKLVPPEPAPPELEQPRIGGVEERGGELLRPRQEPLPPFPGPQGGGRLYRKNWDGCRDLWKLDYHRKKVKFTVL